MGPVYDALPGQHCYYRVLVVKEVARMGVTGGIRKGQRMRKEIFICPL